MSEVESVLCAICSKPEKDPSKVIECLYCYKSEHFKCRNLAGEAIRKLRKQPFYCSLECRNLHAATSKSNDEESRVLKELRTVLTEIRETKSELTEVRNTVKEIEKSQDFVSTKLDGILSEIQELKVNQNKMKKDVFTLQSDQRKIEETVSNLELEVDRINRLALSTNAVILGVPFKANENLNQLVGLIASAVGYDLPPNAITDCKRLISKEDTDNGKNKTIPIRVVFASEKLKEELFEKKKAHGQLLLSAIGYESTIARKIILRDDLTSYGINLLKTAREKQAEVDFKYIWPGRNGVILAKKSDGSKIEVVRCQNDLSKLERSTNRRQLDISSGSSGSPSTPH
ncbi:uncharacterized protein LOC129761058 [Uranotaenia lowii]|uniref:uncharacterized protein LOC129761058 n=1 Tax=Uranotaenia lowii TaxID=190385 RepID=UPI002479B333|nr:uncharacterized protein LOC129761058 [Uranotaenia lowii]